MKALILASLLATAFLPRCLSPDGCMPLSTRCAGNLAQICNADGNWQTQADCDAVSEHSSMAFTCAPISVEDISGHTCVPAATDAGAVEGGVL